MGTVKSATVSNNFMELLIYWRFIVAWEVRNSDNCKPFCDDKDGLCSSCSERGFCCSASVDVENSDCSDYHLDAIKNDRNFGSNADFVCVIPTLGKLWRTT